MGKADLKLRLWFRNGKYRTKFCREHHVTLGFQLAGHESLLAVEFAICKIGEGVIWREKAER